MNFRKPDSKKGAAQAMVEFAIALPILLMLLYGILEAGRLLFLYSSVVTASRQAVRYGSATGIGPNNLPRYQECAEIRRIANAADYLNAFDDADIYITYDSGPGSTVLDTCDGNTDTGVAPSTNNTTRIQVRIEGDFYPLVPRLVPFIRRATATGNPIVGISARTILVSIAIAVTNTPDLSASTPTFTPTQTSTPSHTPTSTRTFTPTNTLQFTWTPSRTPTRTPTPTRTLTPTITFTPTRTLTPSRTPSPTLSPTPVANCGSITHGPITNSGNQMTMTISSPVTSAVQIQDVFVVWNHDGGNQTGSDKSLRLQSVSLGATFWTGDSPGPSITITPSSATFVPTGTSTIRFTFHQSYDNWDGTEEILINLSTSGCQSTPIHAP